MRTAYSDNIGGGAPVFVDWQRLYGTPEPAPYLLTVSIRPSVHGYLHAYPQARAVADDFGNLAIVGEWY